MLGGLHDAVRRAYHRDKRLYELHLDLLYQCDLDCEHCYLDDKSRPLRRTAFWKDVIDQAASLGVASLLVSGGEPLLRKDALEILRYARERLMFVHLKSHGGTIDQAVAQTLAELGITTVTLSYYAANPAIHDAITRRPGSHAATLAALGHLTAAGVTTIAACSLMAKNRDEVPALIAQCASLGVPLSLDGEIRTALSGDRFPQDEAADLDARIALETIQASHDDGCDVPSPTTPWEDRANCAAGISALYVDPEGRVTPCITWPEPIGDLGSGDTLSGIWTRSRRLKAIQAIRRKDREICARCAVRDDCDFCMGQAYVETGDPLRAIRTLCRTTRAKTLARARALGLPDPPLPEGLKGPAFEILTASQAASLRPIA